MNFHDERDILYQAGLSLVREGLVARTWGNISLRLDETRFLITPSGRTYETLSPDDMVVVNTSDLSHEGDIKPSSEKGLHAEVYKNRPEITAVIHTHQLQASTVAAARVEVTGLTPEQSEILGRTVRCAAYGLPGTKKLAAATAAALDGGRNAALMANHGAVCIGSDMEAAFDVAVMLEAACEAFIAGRFAEMTGKTGLTLEEMHETYLARQNG